MLRMRVRAFRKINSCTKEEKEQHKLPKLYSPLHYTLGFVITRRSADMRA
jgi:hypothetical protein